MTNTNTNLTATTLENLLLDIPWGEVHRLRVFGDSGETVDFFYDADRLDGEKIWIAKLDASSSPITDAQYIGSLKCWGQDVDMEKYVDGLYIENEDGTWRNAENEPGDEGFDNCISERDVLLDAIENGEFSDDFEDWKNQLVEQFRRATTT